MKSESNLNKKKLTSNLTQYAFDGFSWMVLGSIIQVILKIGVLAILARLVSPSEFGIMGIAIVILEFSKMFAQMGVGPAIIQRKDLEERHLTTGLTLSLSMGVFFAVLLLLCAPYIANFFIMSELTQILRVVAVIFLIDSLTLIGQALLQRNMKFKTIAMLEVIAYALGYGLVGIALAYSGRGVWSLVAASLSQAGLFTIFLLIVQPFPKRLGFDRKAFKELLFFGGGMTIAKFGNYLASQGDNLVIGKMLGAGALGIYGRAYQFMAMPAGLVGNALDRTLFPVMSKVQDDKERLAKGYLTGAGVLALIAIPVSTLFIFAAHEIVMVLLGPSWEEVVLPLQILAGSLLFRMSYKMSDSLARAAGAVYSRAWRQLLYAAMVLVGSYIGQFWGIAGVATAVAVALVVNFLSMAQLSIRITGATWMEIIKAHLQGVGLGVVTATMSYFLVTVCRAHDLHNILTLLIVVAGSALPLILIFIFFPKLIASEELRSLFDMLIVKRFKNLIVKSA